MSSRLVIIGASGHGKVVADIALLNGYRDIVFVDDSDAISECAGFPVIGKTVDAYDIEGDKFIAIGNARVRETISQKIKTVSLIHPNAVISRRVSIGEGTVVMAGAVINSDVVIGKGCIINTSASVDHDCMLGNFVHVAVDAHLCGTVKVGDRTWVGAGSVISNNIDVCEDCMIGAGGVVVRDITEPGTYVGVPAKNIGRGVCK